MFNNLKYIYMDIFLYIDRHSVFSSPEQNALNDFFSKSSVLISTKFGRKHLWEWRFNFAKIKGLAPNGAQKGVKFGEFKKTSSHELAFQILYLIYSILGTWFVKFAHKNKIHPKLAPLASLIGALYFT